MIDKYRAIQIERINEIHAIEAARLHVETWQETYSGLLPSRMIDWIRLENAIPMWEKLVSDPNFIHLGAFIDNKLAGLGSAGKPRLEQGFDQEIWSMNVPRRNQRLGVGKAIFLEFVKILRSENHQHIYLNCIDKNTKALNFYKAMGGTIAEIPIQREGYCEYVISWDLNLLARDS